MWVVWVEQQSGKRPWDHIIHSSWLIDGETESHRKDRACPKSNSESVSGCVGQKVGLLTLSQCLVPRAPGPTKVAPPLPSLSSWGCGELPLPQARLEQGAFRAPALGSHIG